MLSWSGIESFSSGAGKEKWPGRASRRGCGEDRARRRIPLVVKRDEDLVAADLDAVGRHRLERWQAERLAGPDVESRAVAGALDFGPFEVPLGERAAIVRADVVDCVNRA